MGDTTFSLETGWHSSRAVIMCGVKHPKNEFNLLACTFGGSNIFACDEAHVCTCTDARFMAHGYTVMHFEKMDRSI